MIDIIKREWVYFCYYFNIQIGQTGLYWVLGILVGSLVSVFGKTKIHSLFLSLEPQPLGFFGIIPASLLGIASPLCMAGTIPIVASFSAKGMRDDWLAAFMMSSMLLNPQLLIYSAALGKQMFLLRLVFAFLGGIGAGLLVRFLLRGKPFFSLVKLDEPGNRDTQSNLLIRLGLNIWRNIKVTGPYFLLGMALTALYQRYVPQQVVANIFGFKSRGFGVLLAATLGVPLYVCGGGTIPLLAQWLHNGMSAGSAVAFMISGPATKITNLSALKIVFKQKHFLCYLGYVILLALVSGMVVDALFK